jgi:hypothetical protein
VDEPIAQRASEQPTPEAPALIDGLEPGMTIVRRVRGPRRWPGILSGVLALLMLAATAIGIQLAAHNQLTLSTYAAYAAIALSIAALIFGLIAIAKRWGRGAGIAGAVVAVLGNPLVLLYGLSALGGS